MYYVIQEGMFREEGHKNLVNLLERHGFEYEEILFRPFVEGIDLKTDRKDVFVFGSVNLNKKISKYKLNPGTLDNENHDFEVYGKYYGNHMLNSDGIICTVSESIGFLENGRIPYTFFSRPTKDTKSYSGQLFTHDSWKEWIKELDNSSLKQTLSTETKVLLSSTKDIQQEIRCWIVDGKVVTMSQYRTLFRRIQENMDGNDEAREFAQKMAQIFCPAKAFVLDICLYNDEWKVVEINCINSAGFYKADMSKLLQAIECSFN